MSEASAGAEQGHDPLKAVADAMEAAVEAARQGVADAQATATEAAPAVSRAVSNAVYKACYGISYGVVFPSVLLARSLPANNAVINGFVDGGRAALDMVNEMKGVGSTPATPAGTILGPSGEPMVHPE
jgi:hypothetical protein